MAYKYKVGDIIRIKKREEKSDDYPYSFCDTMNELAGTICEIKKIIHVKSFTNSQSKYINDDYHMYEIQPVSSSDNRDFVWAWHSSMFEPITEDSETQISTSLKEGDLIPICGMIGQIELNSSEYSGYYLYFDDVINKQEHSYCCEKLRELVPNFDEIADEYNPVQHGSGCFPEFSTIDDLIKFTQAVNNAHNSKKSITITKTSNENEIKFPRAKASSKRGIVPTGRAICGRRCKTAIKLGHLSNTTCNC